MAKKIESKESKAKTPAAKPAKSTTTKGTKATTRKPAAVKAAVAARGPRARVVAKHGSKDALAKALASVVARADEDTDVIAGRLAKASNHQLLRLQAVADTVTKKFGNRDKLIAAITTAENKAKDKDFVAKLDTLSLPNLLDLATAAQRRARA